MDNNYFFVDGSALLGDIRRARTDLGIDPSAKLDLKNFAEYFTGHQFQVFLGGGYRRFVFYFVKDDERLRSFVQIPDFSRPGEVSDLRIEYWESEFLNSNAPPKRDDSYLQRHQVTCRSNEIV